MALLSSSFTPKKNQFVSSELHEPGSHLRIHCVLVPLPVPLRMFPNLMVTVTNLVPNSPLEFGGPRHIEGLGNVVIPCFRDKRLLEFRRLSKLNRVRCSFSVAPHEPGRLCRAGAECVLYEDRSKHISEVRSVDCASNPPKHTSGTNVTHTQQSSIVDMTCLVYRDRQLLITTRWYGGRCFTPKTLLFLDFGAKRTFRIKHCLLAFL